MKRMLLGLGLVALASATLAAPAAAQVSATDNIQVTGTVAGALTVAAGNDLQFGIMIPGLARVIAPSDPTAGTFLVDGEPGASVQLSFPTLPAVLTGPGTDIPLTFQLVYNTANDPLGGTNINPAVVTTPTTALSGAPDGFLYIFLGGTATPAGGQTPGAYSATFTLQADYVNN